MTKEFIRLLMENYPRVKFKTTTESYASIVNVSSVAGKNGGPGFSHLSVTKSGADGFAKSVAQEFGDRRIRCNTIVPYFIHTPALDSALSAERRDYLAGLTSLGRLGSSQEVADLIYFLATDSSSYVTGASIDINGGL